jgi:hypothetical protein
LIDYPNLDIADAGKLPNIGCGSVEGVRAHAVSGGATALLDADITDADTSLSVEDTARFPDAPFAIQIASERMRVTAKAGNTFTVTRGYDGTAASAHGKGRTVFEARPEYVYLLSPEPVKEIRQVYVDGVRQTAGFAAYTGRAGDEHPEWPGRAVISFSTDAEIRRQRNAEENPAQDVGAVISAASHRELIVGGGAAPSSSVALGGKRNSRVWAAFSGSGKITKQKYEASIKNPNASDGVMRAVVKDISSGAVIRQEKMVIPAGSTKTVEISEEGGGWATEFSLVAYSGSFEVYYLKKTATVLNPPEEEMFNKYSPPVSLCSLSTLRPKGKTRAWALYAASSQGVIARQTHYAEVKNLGAGKAKIRLIAVDSGGSAINFTEKTVAAGAAETISLTHAAGGWDAMTKIALISGEARVDGLYKEVCYVSSQASEKPFTTASARVVIGDEVTADADWTEDATGDYGGVGTLIERPDHVIKHFIVSRMGFSPADIDEASFDEAGSFYGPAGYRFGFLIGDAKPSEFMKRLALECRSTLRYDSGKWRLNVIPDAAPAPIKTISYKELAGTHAMFRFSRMPLSRDGASPLANEITALYKRDYLKDGWLGVANVEDASSKSKYGVYKRVLEFHAVRHKETAEHVLGHILLMSKTPRLTVEFPVFYEHFDLSAGDTIEIDNPLYGGRKFYIEEIRRMDKFRAVVRAEEWWG